MFTFVFLLFLFFFLFFFLFLFCQDLYEKLLCIVDTAFLLKIKFYLSIYLPRISVRCEFKGHVIIAHAHKGGQGAWERGYCTCRGIYVVKVFTEWSDVHMSL